METLRTKGLWERETGEIVKEGDLPFVRPGEKLVNNTDEPIIAVIQVGGKQSVSSVSKRKRLEKAKESFGMYSVPMLREVLPSLDANERAALMTLALYVDFDGSLQYQDENGKQERLTVGYFQRLMGWSSKTTADKVLDGLEDKGLVVRVKAGRSKYLELNPAYFFQGRQDARNKKIKAFADLLEQARKAA